MVAFFNILLGRFDYRYTRKRKAGYKEASPIYRLYRRIGPRIQQLRHTSRMPTAPGSLAFSNNRNTAIGIRCSLDFAPFIVPLHALSPIWLCVSSVVSISSAKYSCAFAFACIPDARFFYVCRYPRPLRKFTSKQRWLPFLGGNYSGFSYRSR